MNNINETLITRRSNYGKFEDNANVTQSLMDVIESSPNYKKLSNAHKECFHMIFHKIARIVCGDLGYIDNYHDIVGYAKLLEEHLEEVEQNKKRVIEEGFNLSKWDKRFYHLAKETSEWSKDESKVGCVLISPDRKQINYGYNGFPSNIKDDKRLKSPSIKNKLTVHAEINAILNSKKDLTNWTLYCNKFPCLDCAKIITQSGVRTVIVSKRKAGSKWFESQNLAYNLMFESGIEIKEVF